MGISAVERSRGGPSACMIPLEEANSCLRIERGSRIVPDVKLCECHWREKVMEGKMR